MRTRRNTDRALLESLVRKYGKNGVKNAINEMYGDDNFILNSAIKQLKKQSVLYKNHIKDESYIMYNDDDSTQDLRGIGLLTNRTLKRISEFLNIPIDKLKCATNEDLYDNVEIWNILDKEKHQTRRYKMNWDCDDFYACTIAYVSFYNVNGYKFVYVTDENDWRLLFV